MSSPDARPAFYAARSGGRLREWWTLLHPPYTLWHLSYVAIGASLATRGALEPLFGSLVAFFLAVGVGAHALDELKGRPLGTSIPASTLAAVAALSLAGAVGVGILGVLRVGPVLIPFVAAGAFLALAYNLELFGGRLHNDFTFALGWGSFPLLTAYVAEARDLGVVGVVAAGAAFFLSAAQRALSTRARRVRRAARKVDGRLVTSDGAVEQIDVAFLLRPIERGLLCLSWFAVLLATALALERFG